MGSSIYSSLKLRVDRLYSRNSGISYNDESRSFEDSILSADITKAYFNKDITEQQYKELNTLYNYA